MATHASAYRDAFLERLVDRISDGYDALIADYRAWRVAQETAAELRRLSPRELADIGVRPFEIDAVARGATSSK